MNIQFSNWKLINLSTLDSNLASALTDFYTVYDSFDTLSFNAVTVTNTQLTGTFTGPSANYSVVVLGNNFTTDTPTETYTSIRLINSDNTAEQLLTTGSVTYNYDTDTFSGFYNKLSYVSNYTAGLTNLLIEGRFNVDSFGDTIGGSATKYNFTFNGNTINLAGNFLLDADNEITGGTVSSFTFVYTDINGVHSITANGLSLSAVDFNNLTDPDAPNSHLNLDAFYNYLTDASRLTGNDTITAIANDTQPDTINGYAGNDTLGGGGGNDTLSGGLGADTLDGGTGEDTMEGGDGNDTYIVDDTDDTVTETNTVLATGGTDTVKSSALNYTLTSNVENLILTNNIDLNGGNATINGTGNALNNIITGNAGDNILDGKEGNDTLNGGDGIDNLTGGAGIDKLTGGKSNDTYNIDLVRVSALATSTVALQDTVSELANPLNSAVEGIDTIILTNLTGNAGAPIDTSNITNATSLNVNANIENFDASQTGNIKLNITGNILANTITGNDADNILDGGLNDGKRDTLIGRDGNDTYLVDISSITTGTPPAPVVVTGAQLQDDITENNGEGIDTLKLRGTVTIPAATAAHNIALTGALANIENLDISLTGTTRLNLTGNNENNFLTGNAANNTLTGGFGNDTLDGGIGADTMDGGDGDDTYVVDSATDVILDNFGFNKVQSKLGIDLNSLQFNNGQAQVYDATLIGTGGVNVTGNSAINTLVGNDGFNVLDGKGADDTMRGGKGDDTYIVSDAGDVVEESFNEGKDTVKAYLSYTLSDNVENLTLLDTAGNGTANQSGTGNALSNTIIGSLGVNFLDGLGGKDILIGGKSGDTYDVDLIKVGTGTTATLALQDTVTELAGATEGTNDTLRLYNRYGGANNNALLASEFSTYTNFTLAANLENISAQFANDLLINLTGNTLANDIVGNNSNNVLDGGAGIDSLRGSTGNDTYIVDLTSSFTQTTYINQSGNFSLFNLQDTVFEGEGVGEGSDTLKIRGTFSNTSPLELFAGTYIANVEGLDVSLTGAAKINLTGDNGDNNLVGNAAANIITGDVGNDILDGRAGADVLNGGAGDDTYFVDVIKPTTGTGGDVITDSSGTDTVKTIFSADLKSSQFVGIENLTLLGTAALNATGDEGDNVLIGNDGANILDGGAGADDMHGGKGNDTYIVDNDNDTILESANEGIDLIKSSVSFDLRNGTNVENLTLSGIGNNAIGNNLANIITGNSGNNDIQGEAGADTLIGGAGSDTYYVNLKLTGSGTVSASVSLEDTIIESGADIGTDTIILSNESFSLFKASTITLSAGVENLFAANTNYTLLNFVGNSSDNQITGSNSDNIFNGGAGNDILSGREGNDTLFGEAGNDQLIGGNGNDILDGGLGNDTLEGNVGDDTYVVDIIASGVGANITVDLQDSFNEFNGSFQDVDTLKLRGTVASTNATLISLTSNLGINDLSSIENLDSSLTGATKLDLTGNNKNNFLIGNAANNTLTGDAGNDILDGKAGADILNGGTGNDTYFVDVIKPVGAGGDVIVEDSIALNFGNDTVNTTFSADLRSVQFDGIENLTILGAALNATGDDGNNELIGNANANTIIGGAGDDEITGGAGNDILTGGLGVDTFVWNLVDKGTNGAPRIDRITDFSSTDDKLDLRDLLVGESSGNILNYLDITTSVTAGVTNTEIRISNTGGFAGGNYSSAAENQHITLAGVNLLSGTNETDLLANLIAQNKLIID